MTSYIKVRTKYCSNSLCFYDSLASSAQLGFCSSLFTEETAVYFLQKYECFSFTPLHPCTFQTCKYLELCSLWWNKHNQGSMSTLYKTLFLSQSRAYVLNSLKVVVLWKMFFFLLLPCTFRGINSKLSYLHQNFIEIRTFLLSPHPFVHSSVKFH